MTYSPDSFDDKSEKIIELKPIKPTITFQDVIGMDSVKYYMYDNVINPIKNRQAYLDVGKKIGTGTIMFGASWCGKDIHSESYRV